MQDRSRTRLLLAGGILLLAYSVLFSTLAPGGEWLNHVFGISMWLEHDPGGWYIASAHELFSGREGLVFPGHPGLPLQVVLAAVQHLRYAAGGGAASGLSFSEFTARQLVSIWWLSKLACTVVQLFALWSVYALARRLLESRRAATFATLGFATSLSVLYFISRVSVEGWVVLCFCLTFLALESARVARARGALTREALWACLAGVAAVSGAFSKLHLLAPLPLVAAVALLVGPPAADPSAGRATAWRVRVGAFFLVASLGATLAYSTLMDWGDFLRMWREATNLPSAVGESMAHADLTTILLNRVTYGQREFSAASFLPGRSRQGLFAMCELPFGLVAGAGLLLIWREPVQRARFRWPGLCAALTIPVWALRETNNGWSGFHYLTLVMLMLSLAYGQAIDRTLARLRCSELWAVTATILLHGVSLWAAADSRIADVRQYRELGLAETYRAVENLASGQRLLIVGEFSQRFHGVVDSGAAPGRQSLLLHELDDRLVRRASLAPDERAPSALARRGVVSVVDTRGPTMRVVPLEQWRPRRDRRGAARTP